MTTNPFAPISPCPGCNRPAAREHPEATTIEDLACRRWHVRCARVALAAVERVKERERE